MVASDPIGPHEVISEMIDQFLEYAHERHLKICLLSVSERYLHLFEQKGFISCKIGEEAIVDLSTFTTSTLGKKVRRAVRHISNEGITFSIYDTLHIPRTVLIEMQRISSDWLQFKGGQECGYSMTLGRVPTSQDKDCQLVVAKQHDRILGFLSLVPVYGDKSLSIDLMRRSPTVPNGLTEAMIVFAADYYKKLGFRSMSLNFSLFSNSNNDVPSILNKLGLSLVYSFLSPFLPTKSLYIFNNKFKPRWRSRYILFEKFNYIPQSIQTIINYERLTHFSLFTS